MRPGLTKDDIYKIPGRPHYDEGMYGVREWDYLFHFHTPGVGIDPEKHFRRGRRYYLPIQSDFR